MTKQTILPFSQFPIFYNMHLFAGPITYISRVVGIAAVISHEAKPSVIRRSTENEWNISQNFTTAHAITLLIPWHTTGALYHFFHVGR